MDVIDAARGTRTFGEIGHEMTLGRTTGAIVNKFSTMPQNSWHVAALRSRRGTFTRRHLRMPITQLRSECSDDNP
jgi:hypothetical protein